MLKWIDIEEVGDTGKTKRFGVFAKDGRSPLGEISWFGRWRRYTFKPFAGTVYEQQCLRDIAAFCELQTKTHKEKAKADMAGV